MQRNGDELLQIGLPQASGQHTEDYWLLQAIASYSLALVRSLKIVFHFVIP